MSLELNQTIVYAKENPLLAINSGFVHFIFLEIQPGVRPAISLCVLKHD
jgi:hypothetical protein